MISVQQKGGHLQYPGHQSTPQAQLERLLGSPDIKGRDFWHCFKWLECKFHFISYNHSLSLVTLVQIYNFATHRAHSDCFYFYFYFFEICPNEYFVIFYPSGFIIMEAAVVIINETFDGILGANLRASSSYSACRWKEPVQINKSGHLSERRRLCLCHANAPHQTLM